MSHKLVSLYIGEGEYYTRTDADNVIAELNTEIDRLQKWNKKETKLHMDIESRQKCKRCLAMAEWCDAEADVADADGDYDDMRWYQKWHDRWLKIAEKFKED